MSPSSETILQVDNMTKAFGKNIANDSISFDLQKGEILGISGLVGAGRTEIARAHSRMLPRFLPKESS